MSDDVFTGRRLSVVIPAFDEEEAVGSTVKALRSRLPDAEVIVVDDGSADGTAAAVMAVPGVRVVRHAYNAGYGAAIKTGVSLATREYVAWFDADDEHKLDDLVAISQRLADSHVVAVIGRRRLHQGTILRIAGKTVISTVARSLDIREPWDLNCGLRAFRRDIIVRYLTWLPDGFSASLTSTMIMIERHHPIAFVPVSVGPRIGTSKVRMKDGLETLMLVVRMIMLFAPLRIFLRAGLLLAWTGLVYGTIVSFLHRQGFPSAAALAITIGFMLCMLGLVADQISQLRADRLRMPAVPLKDEPITPASIQETR